MRNTAWDFNYCKLRKDISMLYWGGASPDSGLLGSECENDRVVIAECKQIFQKKIKQPGRVPAGESRMERIMEHLREDMKKL